MTKNGVEYKLENSPFRVTVGKITYVFSSRLHKGKFIAGLEEHRQKIHESLTGRFKVNVMCDTLADLNLYQKVETRGFLLIMDGKEYVWPREISYIGGKVIGRQSQNSSESLMQN